MTPTDALRFYANPQNWEREDLYSSPHQDFPYATTSSKAMLDAGKNARAALAAAEKDESELLATLRAIVGSMNGHNDAWDWINDETTVAAFKRGREVLAKHAKE